MTLARRKTMMTAIWDKAFLKQRERNLREDALAVQSDDDWESAVLILERGMSDISDGFRDCPLSSCRRAHRCVGNKPICMPRCKVKLVPGGEQECVEEFYADIQQERRDAAAENRAPFVERAMTHRVHVEDEEIDEPPPAPRDEAGRNMEIVRHAVPRDVAPAPKPQPPLRQPAPPLSPRGEPPTPLAVTPAPPVAPAPRLVATPALPAPPLPPAEPQTSPEVEDRVNRIWADYVAGRPLPRPEPRIRSLSDDRPWSVPPWWKGSR
jgi:hypothetical protein